MPFQVVNRGFLDDVDSIGAVEQGLTIPSASDAQGSYVYYDCTIGVMLDSGIVVHNRLPQVNNLPDTLGSILYDDSNMDKEVVKGVNLRCQDQYQDIVQRMGHARYWFRLWGQAIRIGYKVPIPTIKTIGGVAAVPYDKNPQWAYNRIAPGGNFGGAIMWLAAWSLWYTTITPPISNNIPNANPTALVTANDFPNGEPAAPKGIQVPFSLPDDNSKPGTGSILPGSTGFL